MSLKIRLIILITVFSLANLLAQNPKKHTISGYVKDDSSGEYLIGASVYLKETFQGVGTNTYGFYSLTVPEGEYTVVVSYLGFDEFTQKINLNKDFRINVSLKMKVLETKVFEIVDERIDNNVKSTDMGRVELNVEEMKKLPAFMGEVDVIKIVQLIPGIKSAGEGNTGFYVRGGGPDQNLVLLDEAIVYNAAHLFGFFSVFNPDAIKGVDVHKGGMPAQYGGRLASVLDIQMKEGNNKKYKVDGGIGLIASRLTVQGPIKKDTSSFIISGRRTYLDVLAQPFVSKDSPFRGSGYYFYDLNTKINYRLSDKDRLFLSGYFGRDVFTFKNENSGFDIRIPWGNATASARWNHLFNDKLFLNTSLIFSDYQFESNIEQSAFKFGVFSGIRDYNAKMDFSYFPNIRHQIKFGANYIYHRFTPNNVSAELLGTEFDLGEEERLYAHESAIYVSDDFDISEKFRVHFGLRGSSFMHVGPFTRYVKNEAGETIDEIKYNRGDKIKQYNRVEPRLMMRYSLDMKSSIKASYTQNYQYLHLTSFVNVSLPTDIWIPSTSLVEPQFGQQYSLGYYRNFKQNMFETSAEVYYKRLENQVEFKDGTLQQDQVKDNLDNSLTFGSGRAYGIELFAKKALGKTTGWVGYTLSYTTRIFPELNLGESFFARYDRRHDISVVANHELTKKWTLAAIFVYSSGNLLWMPTSQYFFEGNFVAQYDTRNNFRMPAYHRLDLSATYIAKDTPKYKSSWNFSIYNVYSRLNPYFIYIDTSGNPVDGTLKAQAKMVSLVPIIPSVTYNFSF